MPQYGGNVKIMEKYIIEEMRFKNIVVGTGAAGYNAASRLVQLGEEDTVIITEGVKCGTSRNTGSDKQTYYKLSLGGEDTDSPLVLAKGLFEGGCVDGDLALCEAALSSRAFYRLVESGVPFPDSQYGEYMGYKTDHDTRQRATSAGPYTSKIMTECLEKEVQRLGIRIFDQYQVIRILETDGKVNGLLCLDKNETKNVKFVVFYCENVIYATGGPAGMYHDSVFPISQFGSSGIAFLAGVKGVNLTEWQFGMASIAPRWNVSGTYMQVLPRFISTDENLKDQKEFLIEEFDNMSEMLSKVFLKGYQWPFDVSKVDGGSSIIDLLVYRETVLRKRRVFLDYRDNPGLKAVEFEKLIPEARAYLENAQAYFGKPIDRLYHMNEPAIAFYQDKGINLKEEMLEIAVCAQHNNGGLKVDNHWETNLKGFFAVGEVCGSHGVTRPGGSALNAGQVGSLRAAECIAYIRQEDGNNKKILSKCHKQIENCISLFLQAQGEVEPRKKFEEAAARMSAYGGMVRSEEGLLKVLKETNSDLKELRNTVCASSVPEISWLYRLYDMLISQKVYLESMLDYLRQGGKSRGSALYTDMDGSKASENLPDIFTMKCDGGTGRNKVQEIMLDGEKCSICWRKTREIPQIDYFFETQWREFRKRRHL